MMRRSLKMRPKAISATIVRKELVNKNFEVIISGKLTYLLRLLMMDGTSVKLSFWWFFSWLLSRYFVVVSWASLAGVTQWSRSPTFK